MTSYHSYPKIYNVGHAQVSGIFDGNVLIEEKLDGSQFSFGVFNGQLKFRSKGCEMTLEHYEKMFQKAVDTIIELKPHLLDGYTYRAEFLSKPKHNTLAYDRTPTKNLMIFDISPSEETYLSYNAKAVEAARLGLEVVPVVYEGDGSKLDASIISGFLDRVSALGGQKIEGVVIKRYDLFGPDKKVLMAKHVSEAFKETHRGDWKERHPTNGDVVDRLIASLKTDARWHKAVQHLREAGQLTNSPKDIPALIEEVKKDILAEESEMIIKALLEFVKPRLFRGVLGGFPEWYKQQLLKSQFDKQDTL